MAGILGDLGNMTGVYGSIRPEHSTSRKGNTELNMEDFLKLMIVQLTSQTIDDTMDTSEMMNQLVQMQMITAITNMTEVSVQSYANSLVGQVVTVGYVQGDTLEERVVQVMGTGTFNGQQVIFASDGNMYYLSQIMAVGILPDENGKYPQLGDKDDPTGEESYDYEIGGKKTTIYVGADGKAGTADDWYYADKDGDGKNEKVFIGPDGVPGTDDDWYDSGHKSGPDDKQNEVT